MKANSTFHMGGTGSSRAAVFFYSVAITVAVALFFLYSYTTPKIEDYGSDTSIYIETARTLLHDHRYWFNYEPHTTYPPGFPVLLAVFMSFVGESFPDLVKIMPLFGFLGLAGIFFLVTMQMGGRVALMVVILSVTSYTFYFFTTWTIASDAPYFAATALALLFFEIANSTERNWVKALSYLLVSLLVISAVLIRSIGIALIAGLFLWTVRPIQIFLKKPGGIFLRKKMIWIPVVIVSAGALWGWTQWANQNKPYGSNEDYMNSYERQILKEDPHQIDSPVITLGKIPARMLNMMISRAENAGRIIFNLPKNLKWSSPFVALTVMLIIIGFATSLIHEGRLHDWYFLSYVGILLLWPFDEGTRFLFPVQPFLYLYMIISLKLLYEKTASHGLAKYYPLCLAFFISMLGYNAVLFFRGAGSSKQDMINVGIWFLLCCITAFLYFRKSGEGMALARGNASLSAQADRKYQVITISLSMALAVIIAGGTLSVFSQAKRNLYPDPTIFRHHADVKTAQWIADNTLTYDRIMADEYATLHRLTGRKTFRFPLVTDAGILKEAIEKSAVNYIIVLNEKEYEYYNPSTMKRFHKLRDAYPEMFKVVHDFEQGKIYQVL